MPEDARQWIFILVYGSKNRKKNNHNNQLGL